MIDAPRHLSVVIATLVHVVLFAGGCERPDPDTTNPRAVNGASPTGTDTDAASASASTTAPPKIAPPPFVEVAEQVGLVFAHSTGATGEYYFPEIMGSGCALLDYDGDGDLDVYVVQGAALAYAGQVQSDPIPAPPPGGPTNRLFRNDLQVDSGGVMTPSFVDVTEEAGVGDTRFGMGCAVGDFDNDGDPDLYVTNAGPNVLYRNNGDGTFSDISLTAGVADASWASSAAFIDYDGDGLLDLYVVNYVSFTVRDNKRCYTPAGARDYCHPRSYDAVGDVLYRNRGDGTFEDVTATAGMGGPAGSGLGVACADFNGDGWIDIYVANDGEPNHLWMNRGDGTFENRGLISGTALNAAGEPEAGMGLAVGDFDNDGDDDVFVSHLTGETNTLYRNDGAGWFHDDTIAVGLASSSFAATGFGTGWLDYDHDTYLDLFIANGAVRTLEQLAGDSYPYHQPNQLYHATARGGFEVVVVSPGSDLAHSEVSRGVALGDIDNDGDVDILVSNNNGPLRLLRNDQRSSAAWIRLRLEGVTCNRDALGARVAVTLSEGRRLYRRVHRDGSYASAGDVRIHFGLGAERAAAIEVAVDWPGGLTERWRQIPLRRETLLRQGEGIR